MSRIQPRSVRRYFIIGLSGLLSLQLVGPPAGYAQQDSRPRRIGIISPFSTADAETQLQVAAFRRQLSKLGWEERRNVSFEYRWAGGGIEQIQLYAREMVALAPDVILARTTPVTAALQRQTGAVPIVFVVVADPVADRLVKSLAHPGANITGFTNVESSIGAKWLELLTNLSPQLSQVSVLYNPKTAPGAGMVFLRQIESAARSRQIKIAAASVSSATDIENAIGAARGTGLIVQPDATMLSNRALIISLAARHHVPAIYPWVSAPQEGGLIAYGVDYVHLYERAAGYVDRILRGAKPSDLPVQQPDKFELVINNKAAKELGIRVPQAVLFRADRVIE
jgi:putative ABC transport system substrate-binding protein